MIVRVHRDDMGANTRDLFGEESRRFEHSLVVTLLMVWYMDDGPNTSSHHHAHGCGKLWGQASTHIQTLLLEDTAFVPLFRHLSMELHIVGFSLRYRIVAQSALHLAADLTPSELNLLLWSNQVPHQNHRYVKDQRYFGILANAFRSVRT